MRKVRSRSAWLRLLLVLSLTAVAGAIAAPPRAEADPPCSGRYDVSTSGIVFDRDTKLTWQRNMDMDMMSLEKANTYCTSNMMGLPGDGWRLPTIFELQSLVDEDQADSPPVIDTEAFPNTPASFFWSSSTDERDSPTSKNWYVDFGLTNGGADLVDSSKTGDTDIHYVRCVR